MEKLTVNEDNNFHLETWKKKKKKDGSITEANESEEKLEIFME